MTDIPVGSPPVPPGRHAAPGGWYADPLDPGKERYWDGWQWSRNTRETEAAGQPGQGQPGQGQFGQGQPPQGQPGQYPPGPYGQPPQDPYAQPQQPGGYPGSYPQGGYPPGPYGAGQYPSQTASGGYLQNQPGGRAVATADGVRLAGWWWRLLAVLVDGIIVTAIAAVPSYRIYGRLFDSLAAIMREATRAAEAGQPPPSVPSALTAFSAADQQLLTLISLVVALAYTLLFLRYKAATPGKMLCRLRVVPVDQGRHTGPLPWSTVVVRALIWLLPNALSWLLIFKVLDGLFPLWHPKRQALHDLAAKTQVVKLG